jgi:hypothetical protein
MDIYRAITLAAAFARMEWEGEGEGQVDSPSAGISIATGISPERGDGRRSPRDEEKPAGARRGQGEDRGSGRHFALLRTR